MSAASYSEHVSAVSHIRHVCWVTLPTCLLCHTADMPVVSHRRHVCCVIQQTCLLYHTADVCRVTQPSPQPTVIVDFLLLHEQSRMQGQHLLFNRALHSNGPGRSQFFHLLGGNPAGAINLGVRIDPVYFFASGVRQVSSFSVSNTWLIC